MSVSAEPISDEINVRAIREAASNADSSRPSSLSTHLVRSLVTPRVFQRPGMEHPHMPRSASPRGIVVWKAPRPVGPGRTGQPFRHVEEETDAYADYNKKHNESILAVLRQEDECNYEGDAGHPPSGGLRAPPCHARNPDR